MKRLSILMLVLLFVFVAACSKTTADPNSMDHNSMDHNSMDHNAHGTGHGGHTEAAPDATKAVWKLSPDKPQANENTIISVQIQDDKGQAVEKFDVSHEKLMHLIIVSKDLLYFDHLHPEYKGSGQFVVSAKFPTGGDYKLFADYVPTKGASTTKSSWVMVEGTAPAAAPIAADKDLVKTVAGKEVTLSCDRLIAGEDVNLTFHLVDEKTKKPVTDLQPYLGAVGHVVIMSADAEQYLHVHPTDEKAKGPDARFMTKFPKSGVYKIWGQFQHNGQTFIVPFVVNVS
jgi:hypothetical protein